MAFKFSEEVRRQQCVVGSLKSILDGSVIRLYSGTTPASSDSALLPSNVLLCEITNGGAPVTFESVASGATLTKSLSEVWQGNNVETGTVTFFRMLKPSDSNTAYSNEVRVQGTVGGPTADLTISNASLISGAPNQLQYFAISMLESA